MNEVEQRLREIEELVRLVQHGPDIPKGYVPADGLAAAAAVEDAKRRLADHAPWLLSLVRERGEENRRLREALAEAQQATPRRVNVTVTQAMYLMREHGWPVYCEYDGRTYCYEQDSQGGDQVDPAHMLGQWYVQDDLLSRLLMGR